MPPRIGLFGGSFNPIHIGHLVAAEGAREALRLEKVIFIVAGIPPHKSSNLAPATDRLHMVELAIADNPSFAVSDVEVCRPGPSYTVDTVRAFRQQLGPAAELYFIIGGDSVAELPTWRSVREVAELCRIIPVTRPGYNYPDPKPLEAALGADKAAALYRDAVHIPLLDVSASDIRWRLREGRSVRYLVPEAVRNYLLARNLYRNT